MTRRHKAGSAAERRAVETAGGGRARTASRGLKPPRQVDGTVVAEGSDSVEASKSSSLRSLKSPAAAGLYLIATPIGNAADIGLRALDLLAQADVIACEDTRVTARLLAIHGIARPLLRCDEHAHRIAGPALVERVAHGERVAFVSDAGTPLVSDPGQRLVRACIDAGLPVFAVPGASAVLTALCISGLPVQRFLFAGFLPPRTTARRSELAEVAGLAATLVFLESAQRLAASLADMADVLGTRDAAVAREMTKLFEEVRRGRLGDLAAHYRAAGPPKGEVTVVVGPPAPAQPVDADEADRRLSEALNTLSPRDAAASVAAATGLPRRQLYARAVALRGDRS
ncbi:MAG: 16S rRNA (cytidine(1402)-2'-O)-methyltransferase [Rhodospirillales bacterium]|nr:16S rRNA (cytidine(1402)-2'-O)-methyltransferase [Rhodospirillales bacterium]